MRRSERVRWTLALMVGAWLLVVPAASAYIDAGSTSFIFSAVVAFAMAAGVTVKSFWHRLTGRARSTEADPAERE